MAPAATARTPCSSSASAMCSMSRSCSPASQSMPVTRAASGPFSLTISTKVSRVYWGLLTVPTASVNRHVAIRGRSDGGVLVEVARAQQVGEAEWERDDATRQHVGDALVLLEQAPDLQRGRGPGHLAEPLPHVGGADHVHQPGLVLEVE